MRFVFLLVCLAGSVAARAAASLESQVSQETLSNGLRVIYVPRAGSGVVAVRVVYHVGSREERPDRQGFAHLFEHMMFRGSAHVGPQEHLRLIDRVGGICNGETTADQTFYFDTVPANQLALALWLEADRMASFDVSEAALMAERKVVAQEWAAKRGSTWRWVLDDFVSEGFAGSTYSWPAIGNMEQLRSARVEELREFFATWYVPSNATLILAGGFDVAKTQAIVRRYFGWIGRGGGSAPATRPAVADAKAGVWEIKRTAPARAIVIGVRTGTYADADNADWRVLRGVLRDRLNQYLVRTAWPVASGVDVQLMRMEGAGAMVVVAILAPGVSFDRASDAIFAQVKVIYNEVTQRELDDSAAASAVETLSRRETAQGLTSEIGESLLRGDGKLTTDDELAAMNKIGIAELGRFGTKHFEAGRAVVLHIVPDETGGASAAVASESVRTQSAVVEASTRPTARRIVIFPDDFPTTAPAADDSAASAASASPQATTAPSAPAAEQFVKEIDGAKLIVLPDAATELVHWAVLIRHPGLSEYGKEGEAELTASLLGSTVHRNVFDPRPRKRELILAGVQMGATAREGYTLVRGSAEMKKLGDGLEETRRLVQSPDFLQPDFREETFAAAKSALMGEVAMSDAEPTQMAGKELIAAIAGHPARLPTTRGVAGLKIDDVRGFYRRAYGPTGATVIVAGNVTAESGEKIGRALLDGWAPQPGQVIHVGSGAMAEQKRADGKLRIVVVDRPGAVQCTVRLAAGGYDAQSSERFAGTVAGQILGDGVQSRLGKFVRTERGYAYTVTARFFPLHDEGYFLAACDTEPATLAGTISTVLEQIARMRDEAVGDGELAEAKASLAARGLVREEGALARLESRLAREMALGTSAWGDDEGRADGYDARVQDVSAGEVQKVMRDFVTPERMTVVVVGPASVVEPVLRPFGDVRVVR